MTKEVELGIFRFERETKNTRVYSRDNNGRKETQYVPKVVAEQLGNPDAIVVVLRAS